MRHIVVQTADYWKQRMENIKCPYNLKFKINQMNWNGRLVEIIIHLRKCGYFDILVSFLQQHFYFHHVWYMAYISETKNDILREEKKWICR